jgi:hypothetical protein
MDVDSEVEPTLQQMARCMAVMRDDLLPALRQLDEDAILSYYSVDEQARLYLSAAFTLALSLYALDKITHRQVLVAGAAAGGAAAVTSAPRLTGAGTRHGGNSASAPPSAPSNTDTQLILKIERITEYIKKLQELATLERTKKLAAAADTTGAMDGGKAEEKAAVAAVASGKRGRNASTLAATTAKKAKPEAIKVNTSDKSADTGGDAADDAYGDAQMFSVVSRVAGETGTLVGRLLTQVMGTKNE